MRIPLLLLLLVLIQSHTNNFVKAKEDVSSSEEETKTSEKSENEEKDEEEEDSCLSSPCGSHARCKNVQVCQILFAPECFVAHIARRFHGVESSIVVIWLFLDILEYTQSPVSGIPDARMCQFVRQMRLGWDSEKHQQTGFVQICKTSIMGLGLPDWPESKQSGKMGLWQGRKMQECAHWSDDR